MARHPRRSRGLLDRPRCGGARRSARAPRVVRASALLSHSIGELFERFGARFLLLVRSPDRTVASFAARNWFVDPIPWRDATLPPTLREGVEPRHFFGRNLPRGAEFARWSALSQVGRIAWFWNARNRAILEQLARLPAPHRRICRLEDLDFAHYVEVAEFLGWRVTIDRDRFDELAHSRPNAGPPAPRDCNDRVAAEFEAELGALATALGYEHRVARLVAGASAVRSAVRVTFGTGDSST